MSYNPLGQFASEYEIEGGILYVRGLTVAEFLDLSHQGFFSDGRQQNSFLPYVRIAKACVIGSELDVDVDSLDSIVDMEGWVDIGRFVIDRLTIIGDDVENKLRGFVRYQHFISDHPGMAESYNCVSCLKNGHYFSRKKLCGRFTEDEANELIAELSGQTSPSEDRPGPSVNKYKARRRQRDSSTSSQKQMVMAGFRFPECPTSWIDEWIWVSGNVLYHAEKANIPFADGGLGNQPYKLYRAGRIIAAESSKIDQEEFERESKKKG